jgi:hypothetical protein
VTADGVKVRRRRSRLAACVGGGCGLAGAVCCAGQAIAVAAGIGSLTSFMTLWMNRFQPYVIAVTVAGACWWLVRGMRTAAADRGSRSRKLWRAGRVTGLHAAICLGTYGVAFGLTMIIATLVRGM